MIELDVIDEGDAQADVDSPSDDGDGSRLWRSWGDLRGDEHVEELRQQEFVPGASEPPTTSSRRTFMKIMGASMAMAGLAACRRPEEKILPYARKPEEQIPGVSRYYATAMPFRGVARGLLVEASDGRPTKVEGNPEHPLTRGATSAFAQASVLNLYDPWRSKTVRHNDSDVERGELMRRLGQLASDDTRLAVLMEETSSPAVARMRERLRETYPQLRWVEYAPDGDDPSRQGIEQATDSAARPLYRFDRAEVIASLDADFLAPTRRNYVSNTRTFAESRRLADPSDEMSRLYCAESGFSLTGGQADHRLALSPTKVAAFAQALARQMGAGGSSVSGSGALTERERAFVEELAADLQSAGERGVVVAGETQPPAVHALAMRLNRQLGAVGTTVHLMDTGEPSYTPLSQELRALIDDMKGGRVDALAMIGANPLYDLPASMDFREAMSSVGTTLHAGLHRNETAQAANWHVPRAHYLERWGDARAYDGTVSVTQPLIQPLYEDAFSDLELLNALATGRSQNGYDLLLAQYQERLGTGGGENFDEQWRRILHRGYIPGTQYPGAPERDEEARADDEGASIAGLSFDASVGGDTAPATGGDGAAQQPQLAVADTSAAPAQPDTSAAFSAQSQQPSPFAGASDEGYEVVIQSDPMLLDGRFSNNAWMQETPDPITKLVWDNVAVMSGRTAAELGLEVDYDAGAYAADVVRLTAPDGNGRIELPVWIQPGFPDGAIGLQGGYGRDLDAADVGEEKGWFRNLTDAYESIYNGAALANGVGTRVTPLQDSRLRRVLTGVQAEKVEDARYTLASTQEHGSMEGRPIVRRASMEDYRANPDFAEDAVHTLPGGEPWDEYPTLWEDDHPSDQPAFKDSDYYENQWGMVVDLNTCTGCNACMVACQSENNVQVVGKEQVARGREMHWLRIDRYYALPGQGSGGHGGGGEDHGGGGEAHDTGGGESHGGSSEGGGAHSGEESGQSHGGVAVRDTARAEGVGDVDMEEGAFDDEVLQNAHEVDMVMQPVMCQHCENAPCESVCPVAATVHSPDGMNQMIYNRCIGTRYCSNNCPYKVRRFNYYNWSPSLPAEVQMAQNPDVTVRSRGVMEKCTWCVQRIRNNQQRADNENRPLEDGDVLTACQQACPAEAITFGDLNDPTSEVSRKKKNSRRYEMLAYLNVKPRLSYLGQVSNPNPALKQRLRELSGSATSQEGGH
jgi:molybdopterin-containing oxidoreductase family iron-sulfur binding subunit